MKKNTRRYCPVFRVLAAFWTLLLEVALGLSVGRPAPRGDGPLPVVPPTAAVDGRRSEGRLPARVVVKLQRSSSRPFDKDIGFRTPRFGTKSELPFRKSLLQLKAGTAAKTSSSAKPGQGDEHLYGKLFIGVPRQEFLVAFDTCSGNLVVPDRSCISSACVSHHTYDFAISGTAKEIARVDDPNATFDGKARETVSLALGAGELKGNLVSERVCLGEEDNLCAQTSFIAATDESAEPFVYLPYDGVLGLGMPGASLEKSFNFLGNLAEVQALELDRFAIWLANNQDEEDSEVTFGAFDEGRVASEEVRWYRIARPETGMWQLPLADLMVDDQEQQACTKESPCFAAMDSGSTVIAGPKDIIEGIILRLNVQEDCSNYRSLPMFGFKFGDDIYFLEKTDYVKKTGAGCFHQFEVVNLPPPRGPALLLGEPFLRRFYTVFDRPTLKIGLALAYHANEKDDQTSLSEALIKRRKAADSISSSSANA
mmetsp:Transcript_43397/g.92942  ORF Transcript_43397/g.92942 Transcript_43397/m.92942 type:complete len:483 (+) Transcript_43397:125-1573(+)|eukprot:CAMPEP_0206474000 /NCGR_PEP_ID=MMETSP0324_2-20121206/33217_1 /ASSEMBLY_ACC=CAM_ASM_000836 /TAXON_ID=2866 /ORGANISM="Crypthecodinium cohnii, Strain Seligo" /LENGTH=482 /DNA_ID=CAMNT_0053949071 /DNA_START=53 /DNA_END=1501 /DNA_ORIENTATION=-